MFQMNEIVEYEKNQLQHSKCERI